MLARKKFVAPPDAERGWTDGERVRVCEVFQKTPHAWPASFGSQALDTTEGVLGLLPVLLSPVDEAELLWLTGQLPTSASADRKVSAPTEGQRIGRIRIPTRACLRVTMGTSEVDTAR